MWLSEPVHTMSSFSRPWDPVMADTTQQIPDWNKLLFSFSYLDKEFDLFYLLHFLKRRRHSQKTLEEIGELVTFLHAMLQKYCLTYKYVGQLFGFLLFLSSSSFFLLFFLSFSLFLGFTLCLLFFPPFLFLFVFSFSFFFLLESRFPFFFSF